MTIEMTDKRVTSLRFNEIKNRKNFLRWFFFGRLAETAVLGSPSVWGVSVVAILDCSLNVHACG